MKKENSIKEDNKSSQAIEMTELDRLKIASYDVRMEIQRLNLVLQNIENKIFEYIKIANNN